MPSEREPVSPTTRRALPSARILTALLAMALSVPTVLTAQPRQNPQRDNPQRGNPIQRHVFPPDLVMAHQSEIGLSTEQRQQIIAEVQRMEADLVPLRFEMSETAQEVARLLSASRIDEEEVLPLVGRITELEGEIKKRHLTLVIRTKNLLSAEQQAKLRELRRNGRP